MPDTSFRTDRYLSRSWQMLTRDKGWIKPVLVLTVALIVPVVGPLAVLGYCLEWARLTAWGVDSAPKQRGVRVGECIRSGWRGFVIGLVWGACIFAGGSFLGWVFGFNSGIHGLVSFAWSVFAIFLGVIALVAELRTSIYQNFRSGFQVDRIYEMVRHDAAGLVRIAGMRVVGGLVAAGVVLAFGIVGLFAIIPSLASLVSSYAYGYGAGSSYGYGGTHLVAIVASIASSLGPVLVVATIAVLLVLVVFKLLVANACGLWLRQFDVPAWGASEDPLPAPLTPGPGTGGSPVPPTAPPEPPAPVAPVALGRRTSHLARVFGGSRPRAPRRRRRSHPCRRCRRGRRLRGRMTESRPHPPSSCAPPLCRRVRFVGSSSPIRFPVRRKAASACSSCCL